MDVLDLVIRGGSLITASGVVEADLGIRNGSIVARSDRTGACGQSRKTLDATGLWVVPGAVDPHVHLAMPTATSRTADDWRSGTIAAACGGTTTILDVVEPEPGEPLLAALVKRRTEAADAVIDYGLHMTLTNASSSTLASISQVIAAGVTSFKTYTTYQGFSLDDASLLAVFSAVADAGGIILTHCENEAIVAWCTQACIARGETGIAAYPLSRPSIAEFEAVTRVLALAEVAGTPIYIVHISTAEGAAALQRARQRGQRAWGETCPHYLLLTATDYNRPGLEGAKFICAPPLRSTHDQDALWNALASANLDSVATDHCAFNYGTQKVASGDDFRAIPGGLPGIEARLALVHTAGVREGRLSLSQWIETCCTAPARIFGLYPRKGTLNIGADADIVLFDPQKRVTLSSTTLHEAVDYTPYEGIELCGYPVLTLVGGEVVVKEGQWVAADRQGRYLARSLPGK